MTPLPTTPLTSQDGTVTLPPALGAMVDAILERCTRTVLQETETETANGYVEGFTIIHDTAQRLKVALAQREAVMEEMADALEALLFATQMSPYSTELDAAERAGNIAFAKCEQARP